jgi:hypothetical protein
MRAPRAPVTLAALELRPASARRAKQANATASA